MTPVVGQGVLFSYRILFVVEDDLVLRIAAYTGTSNRRAAARGSAAVRRSSSSTVAGLG
jgi:hypothetical protein